MSGREAEIAYRLTGLPFVTLKLAQTLDGNIATCKGDSKWITSKESRVHGHQLRAEADAILVGRGTVMADDPELSVRYVKGCSPTKIVLDTRLTIPLTAKIFGGAALILVASEGACKERVQARENRGAEVWQLPAGQVNLKMVLQRAVRGRVAPGFARRRQSRCGIGIAPGIGRSIGRVCGPQNFGRGIAVYRALGH